MMGIRLKLLNTPAGSIRRGAAHTGRREFEATEIKKTSAPRDSVEPSGSAQDPNRAGKNVILARSMVECPG
jgi:hypothetical protein